MQVTLYWIILAYLTVRDYQDLHVPASKGRHNDI